VILAIKITTKLLSLLVFAPCTRQGSNLQPYDTKSHYIGLDRTMSNSLEFDRLLGKRSLRLIGDSIDFTLVELH
jgi:hypothetical protein